MSNILIYDVAAESGGALSILNRFYAEACSDLDNNYTFLVSNVDLLSTEKVAIKHLNWVKKSWLHRLFADVFFVPRYAAKNNIDEILSLQNIGVKCENIHQTVYVHNAIPFCDYKFRLLESPYLWVYQNIIGRITYHSLNNVDRVIVQTDWMKDAILRRCKTKPENIIVKPIQIGIEEKVERIDPEKPLFFYPASPFEFKNHKVILEACQKLQEEGETNYSIVFTMNGNENRIAKQIYDYVAKNKLPVTFAGFLDKKNMQEMYCQSCLVFSSYLETIGLPIIEAKMFESVIIASDLNYAHSAVGEYEKVLYFQYNNSEDLKCLMKGIINASNK